MADPEKTAAILAASKGPNGCDATKVPGLDHEYVKLRITKLCQLGQLHRAKLSHKVVRYFDTAERAAAYMVKNGPSAGQVRAAEVKKKAKEFKALKTITPDGIKNEVRENYPPHRFYVDPASLAPEQRSFGGMKPGQYAFEPASCAARAA
jgi:hypothetical protein